jgi:pre-rRNA-processing protein TSR4
MPAKVEDDWSDSDLDYESTGDIETSVQLGIADGLVSSDSDLYDPCVSRIGGRPV